MNSQKNIIEPVTNTYREILSVICVGFILTLFNIDFLCFQYLIPAIGASMMVFSCHKVNKRNKYFHKVYQLSILRVCWILMNFLLDWTVLASNDVVLILQVGSSILIVCFIFYNLNEALQLECQALQLPPIRNYFQHYSWIYIANYLCMLLVFQFGLIGILISIIIILFNVLYLIIVFHSVENTLMASNTYIPVEVYSKSQFYCILLYFGAYSVLLVTTIFLSNKIDWFSSSTSNFTHSEYNIQETKDSLLQLGFSQTILSDLPEDELYHLRSTQSLQLQTQQHSVNGGTLAISVYTLTLPQSNRLLLYYHWITPPSNRLYQIFEYQVLPHTQIDTITGNIIYKDHNTHSTIFSDETSSGFNVRNNPYIKLKLPNEGSDIRGYFAFNYYNPEIQSMKEMDFLFYYQSSIFNLPYIDIIDYMNSADPVTSTNAHSKLKLSFQFTQ